MEVIRNYCNILSGLHRRVIGMQSADIPPISVHTNSLLAKNKCRAVTLRYDRKVYAEDLTRAYGR